MKNREGFLVLVTGPRSPASFISATRYEHCQVWTADNVDNLGRWIVAGQTSFLDIAPGPNSRASSSDDLVTASGAP